ncbi:MAG: lysophospholipid acyltransferase family protein, partial [Desulfuromonadales bacterium]|nr:lysophospholipid acyltransferase family protein [Desulfuromonadales bacterium]
QDDLLALFQIEGIEHLREACAHGKGVFLLTAHLGFWEAGTFLLPALGFPTDFVVRPMKNPYIDRHLTRLRESAGGRCINSRQGARKIVRSLTQNRGVGILLDQHTSRRQAVEVDFFGQKAHTTPVIAEIAMRYDVPVVPIFSYRLPDNRYQVIVEPMIFLPPVDGGTANTALLTACIEKAVRRDIDQWFWLHRRWR